MTKAKVAKSITEDDSFSDPVKIVGPASFVLSGTWEATVHLQRTKDGRLTWDDVTDNEGEVKTWTTNVTANIQENTNDEDVEYRFGVKEGNFTSGTIVGVISQ